MIQSFIRNLSEINIIITIIWYVITVQNASFAGKQSNITVILHIALSLFMSMLEHVITALSWSVRVRLLCNDKIVDVYSQLSRTSKQRWGWIRDQRNLDQVLLKSISDVHAQKWNERDFSPPLCTYRLNSANRTSWGWWDEWVDTARTDKHTTYEHRVHLY